MKPTERMFETWMSASTGEAIRDAWTALSPVKREVSRPGCTLTVHGAAQLAHAMLGERADWLVEAEASAHIESSAYGTDVVCLDDAWQIREPCEMRWELHERRTGARGVQHVCVGVLEDSMPHVARASHSMTIVRVCDGARAASITLGTREVSTVGDIDLAPLDLVDTRYDFHLAPTGAPRDAVLGMVALLAGELDAHYDTCPTWPATGDPDGTTLHVSGDYAITVTLAPYWKTMVATVVQGLPWGHALQVSLPPASDPHPDRGSVSMRLPDADIERVRALVESPW